MRGRLQIHTQLLSLMREALNTCMLLQRFSKENISVFSGEDDEKIVKVIKERESIINILINLEYKIDLILDDVDEYACGNDLPAEIDEIRQTIRPVLSTVIELDLRAMQLLSGKMQKYKDETLKVRNKKHLSAYIKANWETHPYSSYDYKK